MPLSQSMTQEIDTQGKDRWRGQHRRPKLVSGWSRHVLIAALSGSVALALAALPFSTSNVDDALVKPAQAIPRPALVDECSYLPCDAAIREQQPASRKERRSKVKPVPMPLIQRIGPTAITMPAITRDRIVVVKPVGFVTTVPPSPVDTDPAPTKQRPPVEQPPPNVEQPPVEQPPATPLPPPAPPILPVDDDDEDTNCAERWGHSTKEHREDRRARNAAAEDQQETAEASSEYESKGPSAQPVVEGTGTETPAAG